MTLDLHVGFCVRRRPNDTRHWIIILVKPGDPKCTWYHVKGGPQGDPPANAYEVFIEDGKRLNSQGIEHLSEKIATISDADRAKVKAAVQSVERQRCQLFTVAVLAKLEKKGLVPIGTSASFAARVEPVRSAAATTGSGSKSGSSSRIASSSKSTIGTSSVSKTVSSGSTATSSSSRSRRW
ncbi:hypothetical protein M409DRAFT_50443 [Zasmidium cellare ATCC 36951]|uniref:Uncharacterized protein n=1 Tax=Zasmidium cellare ATCC 36951 TaxID=1080233 RepID=A0A6A6CYI9_ZASCE|nr:uncharacterized protein M409DRAFT_50443 [Zasmidium cellare ATCC 36951]KAF2171803.1 hypothetical protein M409DRAFT_50443 [Zasmidium cellare ATCC 36951]